MKNPPLTSVFYGTGSEIPNCWGYFNSSVLFSNNLSWAVPPTKPPPSFNSDASTWCYEKHSWDCRASPTLVSEKVFLKKSLLWCVVCELWSGGYERDPLHLWIAFPCIKHFNCVVRFWRLLLTGRKEKGMEENRRKRKHCHKTWTGVAPERKLNYLPLNTRRLDNVSGQ